MAVVASWDGDNRRIYLATNSFHPIDLYREYRTWRRLNDAARVWDPLMKMDGNIPKGGGKSTPRYLTLLSDSNGIGTKIVPMDQSHTLEITGEIITDQPDTDPEIIDISSLLSTSKVRINYAPAEAEIIQVSTGSGLTAEQAQKLIETHTFALLAMLNTS